MGGYPVGALLLVGTGPGPSVEVELLDGCLFIHWAENLSVILIFYK